MCLEYNIKPKVPTKHISIKPNLNNHLITQVQDKTISPANIELFSEHRGEIKNK